MKEIILDSSLTVEDRDFRVVNPQSAYGFRYQEFEPVTELDVIHRNFLDYLVLCWGRHYGVVISPTILWNMVLSNLAFEVNRVPDTYRKYFTESDEKQEIVVTQGGYLIDPQLLINKLHGYIPNDIIDSFFPKFTTDSDLSVIANNIAFLDMVSPYYNYGMLLCGIPKVRVIGEKADWLKFMMRLGELSVVIPEFSTYLLAVANRVSVITDETADYSEMFSLERCGSGSQVEVSGWIRDFFIEQPRVPYPENFVSCISKIDYKNYNEGGKEYRLYAGLFTSKVEDGYLVPAFNTQYFEKSKSE